MRALLRDAIRLVRAEGGTNVRVRNGGKHTFIEFDAHGQPARVTIHSGGIVTKRFEPMIRSQIRRKLQPTTTERN